MLFGVFRSGDNILSAEALIALVHRQGLLLEVDVRRRERQQLSLPNPRVVHGHKYRVAGGTVFHALDKGLKLVLCPEQHLLVRILGPMFADESRWDSFAGGSSEPHG